MLGFAIMLLVWAFVELQGRQAAGRALPAAALACALLGLLLAARGYRPAPLELANYHDLAKLGALNASRGVTVRERLATASWPGAHFFEIQLGDADQTLQSRLSGLPPGRYRASVMTTAAPGYGRVRVRLAGQEITLDGQRDDGRALPSLQILGPVELDERSRLELQALDGAGARIGLSGLVLEPVPSS